MSKALLLFTSLVTVPFFMASAAPVGANKPAPKKATRGPASLDSNASVSISNSTSKSVVKRAMASVCADAACLCEEVKKLSATCIENVEKVSDDSNRKQFRQLQTDIVTKRRQITDQGKSCVAFAQADLCFERSVKSITQKSPRRRDVKNENATELLGFGSDIMMKLGNQPAGRTPASK